MDPSASMRLRMALTTRYFQLLRDRRLPLPEDLREHLGLNGCVTGPVLCEALLRMPEEERRQVEHFMGNEIFMRRRMPLEPDRQTVDLETALIAIGQQSGHKLGIDGIREQRSGAFAADEIGRIEDAARREEILRNVRNRLGQVCPGMELE